MSARTKPPGPITVKLPDLEAVPAKYRGKHYTVKSLLADGDTNHKLAKSNKADKGYKSFGLSLAPADSSGRNLCE